MSREFSLPYIPLHHRSTAMALASFKVPYVTELGNWRFPNQKGRGDGYQVTDFLPHQINEETSGDGKFVNPQAEVSKGGSRCTHCLQASGGVCPHCAALAKRKRKRAQTRKLIRGRVSSQSKAKAISAVIGSRFSRNGHNPRLSATNALTKTPMATTAKSYNSPLPQNPSQIRITQDTPSAAELAQALTQAKLKSEKKVTTSTTPAIQRLSRIDRQLIPRPEPVLAPQPQPRARRLSLTSEPDAQDLAFDVLNDPDFENNPDREMLAQAAAELGVRRLGVPMAASGRRRRRGRGRDGMSQRRLVRVSNPPYRPNKPTPPPGFEYPVTRGGVKRWIQAVTSAPGFRKGALTRKAHQLGLPKAMDLAKIVKKHPQDFSQRTRRQAQFALNIQKSKGKGHFVSIPRPRKLLPPPPVSSIQLANARLQDQIVLNSRQFSLPVPDRELQSTLTTKPDSGSGRKRKQRRY